MAYHYTTTEELQKLEHVLCVASLLNMDVKSAGFNLSWNYARQEGYFKDCRIVGDFCKALLQYHMDKLKD